MLEYWKKKGQNKKKNQMHLKLKECEKRKGGLRKKGQVKQREKEIKKETIK